ncbi:MAG TPA: P-loop NTPase [Verrucomicrobiae bacterium]
MQLDNCLNALKRRWWVLLLSILFIGGPAVVYAIIRPQMFRSQAMMWLADRLTTSVSDDRFSEDGSYLGTQAELIKSRAIQLRAFQKVHDAYPELGAIATNSQSERLPLDFVVSIAPKSSVLELEAKGRSAEGTRAFLDAVMDEYLAVKDASRQQSSSGALAGITDEIRGVEKKIQGQQQALTLFSMSNNISYLTEHGVSAGSHLAKLDESLSDLRTEFHLLELFSPQQYKSFGTGTRNSFSDTVLPGEKAAQSFAIGAETPNSAYYQALQQIEVLKATREGFSKDLRPTHSKMVKLDQEISGLERLLKKLQDDGEHRALEQMENRKKTLSLQIQSLESQHQTWETNAAEASQKLANYDSMKQELQRSQALYDHLLGLLQSVDLGRNIYTEPLRPLAPASPANPTSTRFKIIAVGLFTAFIFGAGAVVFLGAFDDRFSSAVEVSYHLPDPIIGQIPKTHLNGRNRKLPRVGDQKDGYAFTESFRHLRSSLLLMFEDATRPRTILLTSAVPKEGKSTIAANLAWTLATPGSRVLLIDADFRRSSLHHIFGVSDVPGLSEVLDRTVSATDAIVRVNTNLKGEGHGPNGTKTKDKASKASSLFFLPAGEYAADNPELFLGNQLNGLLHDLLANYDYIIIDGPPVLATDDSIHLASVAGNVIFVVRASYTSSRLVRLALSRLQECRVKVMGVVYNRAATSTDCYYRYGRDYHVGAKRS